MKRHALLPRRVVLLALACVVVALASSLLVASEGDAQGPLPGLSAGVTALAQLPPAAGVPESVRETLSTFDPAVVGASAEAQARLRRLRSNLGAAKLDFYGLRSKTGSVCFILERGSGVCPSAINAGSPGLLWVLGGGTEQIPGSLAGIASDAVSVVDLEIDDQPIAVSIQNNAVFAEIPTGGYEAIITVHYRDDQRTETIKLKLE